MLWNILLLLKSLLTYPQLFPPSFCSSFTGPLKFCKPTSHASKFAFAKTLTCNALPRQLHDSPISFIVIRYYLSIRFSLVTICRWPYYYSHSASHFFSAFIIIWRSKDLLILFSISHYENLNSRMSGTLFNLLLFFSEPTVSSASANSWCFRMNEWMNEWLHILEKQQWAWK